MKITTQFAKILDYFQRPQKSANVAKERLQIIIAHERGQRDNPDYLALLQRDLLEVVAKYVKINRDDVKVELERQEGCSILELNIVLPQNK
ncbi:MAG: cell division topological specificity factor MinE [Rickettsia endosymbiont of Ixodes persulcatus]|nr:cell division topological specificity factor MinE [Rickettsia endosymbiont of Ixodes persulcatus]